MGTGKSGDRRGLGYRMSGSYWDHGEENGNYYLSMTPTVFLKDCDVACVSH